MAYERFPKTFVSYSLLLIVITLLIPFVTGKSFSKKLWEKHRSQAIYSQYTPFIISLAAGNLPLETFQGYLYQDIHYLTAYAQAAYIGGEYATDDEAKQELQRVGDSCILYIQSFASFFQELGLTYEPGSVPKNEATEKYMDFLLTTARTKVTVYAFAAMTPCERLYAYLGSTINNTLSNQDLQANIYKRWITENSRAKPEPLRNRRNLESAKSMEYFIDKLSVGLPQHELDKIEELYKQGLEYEAKFFLAQKIDSQEVVVPLWKNIIGLNFPLVSDFDLSCNKRSRDLYKLKDYEQNVAKALLQIDPQEGIQKAFDLVAKLEKESFPTDVTFGKFKAKSSCISLLLDASQKDDLDANAYVISAHWSNNSINTALSKEGLANTISQAGNKGSIESSIDKLEAFKKILHNYDNNAEENKLSLYIGDSVGDLLSLLEADIGVVYRPNAQLKKVEKHFAISSISLFKGLINQQMEFANSWKNPNNSSVIYAFKYWAELKAFILGYEDQIMDAENMIRAY